MNAFNVVRFLVKPGCEQDFIDAHRNMHPELPGFRRGVLVKTGERRYCMIGEWDDFASIVSARSQMTGILDKVRGMLEDLGSGLGVTDPVSGEVVVELEI